MAALRGALRKGKPPVPAHVLESARRALLSITMERWDYLADQAEETLKLVEEWRDRQRLDAGGDD